VHARPGDETVGEPRIDARMGRGRHPYKRIVGAHARSQQITIGIRLKTIPEKLGVLLVELVEAADRRLSIRECFGRHGLRRLDGECGTHLRNADSLWIKLLVAGMLSGESLNFHRRSDRRRSAPCVGVVSGVDAESGSRKGTSCRRHPAVAGGPVFQNSPVTDREAAAYWIARFRFRGQ